MTFLEKMSRGWDTNNSLLCVGLDSDPTRLPAVLADKPDAIFQFNKAIIDATHDLVCVYKPQIAFYSGSDAEDQLKETISYIKQQYPAIPVLLDAKRGDIGNTAKLYVKEAFEHYGADAVTVNPYMGTDSLEPFLECKDKGIVVLCRTSNPSGKDFQNLDVGGRTLYQQVAKMAVETWNKNNNVSLVVGATCPEELAEVRAIVGDMPLLVPGIGAQGGDIEATVRNGRDSRGAGLMINSSRGIIFAGSDEHFAEAARQAALETRDAINQFRRG